MADVKGAVLVDIRALGLSIGDVVSADKKVLEPYIQAGHIDPAKEAVDHLLKQDGKQVVTYQPPQPSSDDTGKE